MVNHVVAPVWKFCFREELERVRAFNAPRGMRGSIVFPDTRSFETWELLNALQGLFIPFALHSGAVATATVGCWTFLRLRRVGPRDGQTRCGECGFVLTQLKEPRCLECGRWI